MANDADLRQNVERLKKIVLFRGVAGDDDAMARIASLCTTVKVNAGNLALVEGADGNEIYIIKSGSVSVEKRTAQGDSYTVVDLSADMNVFFGEIALLDPAQRSASVLCKTDCEFLVLKRDDFTKFGDENPAYGLAITREVSRILCNRLRKANSDIITLFDALVEEVEAAGGLVDRALGPV